MIRRLGVLAGLGCLLFSWSAQAELLEYGAALCGDTTHFYCLEVGNTIVKTEVKLKDGSTTTREKKVVESWNLLWPDETQREIVKRINRLSTGLSRKQKIAVPRDMTGKTYMDFSPYPLKIEPPGEKLVIWDPALIAYAAYDAEGNLVRWGPAAGGKDYCPDVKRGCRTVTGEFRIIKKGGPNYRSGKYPVDCVGKQCALMPYAMFFKPGYAFHAGRVPGANASHGCVRLFAADAEWMSNEFVELKTKVIVRPYPRKAAARGRK
jgi:L,D-transpeptidase ErfK/SrfK